MVSLTPLGTLALHYLLWAHLIQNVALAESIPLLLVASMPPGLAASAARFDVVRFLTQPFVALPLWLGGYLAWHVPARYDAALAHHALLHLEHLTYLVAGVLLWWPVLQAQPRASPRAQRPRISSRHSSSRARSGCSWRSCRARSTTSTSRRLGSGGRPRPRRPAAGRHRDGGERVASSSSGCSRSSSSASWPRKRARRSSRGAEARFGMTPRRGVRWRVRGKDAGARVAGGYGATEDAASRRPARPGGSGFVSTRSRPARQRPGNFRAASRTCSTSSVISSRPTCSS